MGQYRIGPCRLIAIPIRDSAKDGGGGGIHFVIVCIPAIYKRCAPCYAAIVPLCNQFAGATIFQELTGGHHERYRKKQSGADSEYSFFHKRLFEVVFFYIGIQEEFRFGCNM